MSSRANSSPTVVGLENLHYEIGRLRVLDGVSLQIRRGEIAAFLGSIRGGRPPVVSGEDGLRALETAIRITELVQAGGDVQ